MQLIRIGYNPDTGRKFGNLIVVLLISAKKKFQLGFSSKIEVLRLGLARNLHSSGSLKPENSSSNSSLLSSDQPKVHSRLKNQLHTVQLFTIGVIKLITTVDTKKSSSFQHPGDKLVQLKFHTKTTLTQ